MPINISFVNIKVATCRVIQATRSWLNKSYNDFKDEQLIAKLKAFVNLIQKYYKTLIVVFVI